MTLNSDKKGDIEDKNKIDANNVGEDVPPAAATTTQPNNTENDERDIVDEENDEEGDEGEVEEGKNPVAERSGSMNPTMSTTSYAPPHPSHYQTQGNAAHSAAATHPFLLETRRSRGGVAVPFPQKLHEMLEVSTMEGLSDVVSFFPHGRAFGIHKPRRFVQEVMPR